MSTTEKRKRELEYLKNGIEEMEHTESKIEYKANQFKTLTLRELDKIKERVPIIDKQNREKE